MNAVRVVSLQLSTLIFLFSQSTLAEEEPNSIDTSMLLQQMGSVVSEQVCNTPQIKACFDISQEECAKAMTGVISECKDELAEDMPEKVSPANAMQLAEKLTNCLVPKIQQSIGDKRIDSEECRQSNQP